MKFRWKYIITWRWRDFPALSWVALFLLCKCHVGKHCYHIITDIKYSHIEFRDVQGCLFNVSNVNRWNVSTCFDTSQKRQKKSTWKDILMIRQHYQQTFRMCCLCKHVLYSLESFTETWLSSKRAHQSFCKVLKHLLMRISFILRRPSPKNYKFLEFTLKPSANPPSTHKNLFLNKHYAFAISKHHLTFPIQHRSNLIAGV